MKALAIVAALAAGSAFALMPDIGPFSHAVPGSAIPPGWRVLTIHARKAPDFALVRDGDATVMRVHSDAAVGSLAQVIDADPARTPLLAWRWKVDRVLDKGHLGTREGDDFAARVYVSFEIPVETLSFASRVKMRLAKLVYGADLPSAAICYVWDNRSAPGTRTWNPYTDRIRMVVLQSGAAHVGDWAAEKRDVDADFQEAFGAEWKKATPHITGVAISADTDQTLERVTAWFGDLRLEARP